MTSTSISDGIPAPKAYAVPAGGRVSGRLSLPGSKSVTQRYFNLALIRRLPLVVHRPAMSEDARLFLGALEACGFAIEHREDNLYLTPGQPDPETLPAGEIFCGNIFCGNGGTMFRFLTSALTAVPGTWQLDGIARLRERPVGPLLSALRQLGAEIRCPQQEGYAPLEILGGSLRGGRCRLDAGSSSQFLSSIIMAALAAPEPSEIAVGALTSEPYVDLTLDAVRELGGEVRRTGDVFHVRPSELTTAELTVEADYSAVAYPAAAAMLSGGRVTIEGLRRDSRQGDRLFLDLLERMGGRIHWRDGNLEVAAGDLRAVEADLSQTPDQVPTLAALAPFATGTTRITGVPHLRIKECDRLSAMAQELQRVGAEAQELADGLVIPGVWANSDPPSSPVAVETYGDHRIAMSLALVGLRRPGLSIQNPGVVAKSYPDFWNDFEKLLAPTERSSAS